MKKIIYLMSLLTLTLVSCEKDEKITYDGNAKVTTTLSAEGVTLDKDKKEETALTVSWESTPLNVNVVPSYEVVFTNGEETKSEPVSKSPAHFTVAKLNEIMLKIGVKSLEQTDVKVSVKAKLGINNYLSFDEKIIKVTAFEDLVVPEFYIVGGASYVGWSADKAQGLYKKENISTIFTYLENNQPFRFLGQQNWNPINYSIDQAGTRDSYKYFTTVPATIKQDGEENMKFEGETGIYKITIDNKAKSLEIEKSALGYKYDNLYLVGSINGWNASGAISMTKISEGVFEHTIELKKGDEFKFIGQRDWGELDWGNLNANGNTGYLAPKSNNGNIVFDGKNGTYKITVNLKGGIYTVITQ
ncbi:SusE domain-containing protein [Capnocytophaga cynodegmi]|uniref:SusE domain-containing protein n=1 Tax=Capnocytophaga cynodegmi TaxID=28189 RepID=UPI00385E7CE8